MLYLQVVTNGFINCWKIVCFIDQYAAEKHIFVCLALSSSSCLKADLCFCIIRDPPQMQILFFLFFNRNVTMHCINANCNSCDWSAVHQLERFMEKVCKYEHVNNFSFVALQRMTDGWKFCFQQFPQTSLRMPLCAQRGGKNLRDLSHLCFKYFNKSVWFSNFSKQSSVSILTVY